MTPAQLAALEGIRGRPLTPDEVAAIEPYIADPDNRNDVKITELLSAGRTRIETRMIGERGIVDALDVEDGEACVAALESFAANAPPGNHPLATKHAGIKRMVAWLKTDAGLDIGNAKAHLLLNALAQVGVLQQAWVNVLIALTLKPDPFPMAEVSYRLNVADGRMTL